MNSAGKRFRLQKQARTMLGHYLLLSRESLAYSVDAVMFMLRYWLDNDGAKHIAASNRTPRQSWCKSLISEARHLCAGQVAYGISHMCTVMIVIWFPVARLHLPAVA